MVRNGQNRVTLITLGYDYLTPKGKPNGALFRRWKGDVTCKSGRLATYKAGTYDELTAVGAYTPGTSNKTAWFVLNGVEIPGNSHVRAMQGTPVDAVKFTSPMEINCLELFVAPVLGSTPEICVITAVGVNQPTAEKGMLAWGTPGAGTFTGAGNPTAVALGSDVKVTELKLSGTTPYVSFIPN